MLTTTLHDDDLNIDFELEGDVSEEEARAWIKRYSRYHDKTVRPLRMVFANGEAGKLMISVTEKHFYECTRKDVNEWK